MTTAEELIANAKALLLDFDGPITALMPPPINAQAAEHARSALVGIDLPDEIATTTDHLAVLRYSWAHHRDRYTAVEDACTESEVAAAHSSLPSTRINGWITDAVRRGIPVAVVSNNSEAAVLTFLARFGWTRHFSALSCREPTDPDLMKPDPHLLTRALRAVGVPPGQSIFIGDSVSDVRAGTMAEVTVIGVAKDGNRRIELREAGAAFLL